jgi:hypothetical protein
MKVILSNNIWYNPHYNAKSSNVSIRKWWNNDGNIRVAQFISTYQSFNLFMSQFVIIMSSIHTNNVEKKHLNLVERKKKKKNFTNWWNKSSVKIIIFCAILYFDHALCNFYFLYTITLCISTWLINCENYKTTKFSIEKKILCFFLRHK